MATMKRKRGSKDPEAKSKAIPKPKAPPTVSHGVLRKDERPAKKAKTHEAAAKPVDAARPTAVPAALSKDEAAAEALSNGPATIQIVAGSYDRTLHGVTATVSKSGDRVVFADTFLFNAHASAIRCLALSPPSAPVPGQAQKVMLATGSTDERINIYNLSAHPPARRVAASAGTEEEEANERAIMAAVVRRPVMAVAENAKNRELGTLLHHAATITRLAFPTRSKLLSASEDSSIGVTRTRDWSLLSTIRAPVPKPGTNGVHRPSGDTAAPGQAPSGINDFAVHPSMKVMITVSRGERCMRLWNLVTGKKAGVLNFGRSLLRELGEVRHHATGESRQVEWGRGVHESKDADADAELEDEFAVGFDRNVVVFGMDSLPRCKVLADARTKTHDFHYFEVDDDNDDSAAVLSLLAVATEDGRILLCSTAAADLVEAAPAAAEAAVSEQGSSPLPSARLVGEIGGKAAGLTGRVKAFKVLPAWEKTTSHAKPQRVWYVVAASSTGMLRVWKLTGEELRAGAKKDKGSSSSSQDTAGRQVGQLLGMYQTPDRITCVEAFVMVPRPDGVDESEDEVEDGEDDEDDEDEEDE